MSIFEKLIEEYREGDIEHRLGLFLAYRDLRDDFMQIEAAENPLPVAHPGARQAQVGSRPWYAAWASGCRNMLRRCLVRA